MFILDALALFEIREEAQLILYYTDISASQHFIYFVGQNFAGIYLIMTKSLWIKSALFSSRSVCTNISVFWSNF